MKAPLSTSPVTFAQVFNEGVDMFTDDVEPTMAQADPQKDFALALTMFALAQLMVLARALARGQVVAKFYKLGEKRCLFGWLAGWVARDECLRAEYPSRAVFLAVRRSIRFFDQGKLEETQVASILQDAIRARLASQPRENQPVEKPKQPKQPKQPHGRRALAGAV